MIAFSSRAGRWPLALTTAVVAALVAITASGDDPPVPAITAPGVPAVVAGDVITVSNTSGGTELGSLRWALLHVTGQQLIRFDPSLAGATITLDSTLNVTRYVTIEGPKGRGITLSGGGARRVMYVAEGAHLKNLTITGGYDPVVGGGIFAYGPLRIENSVLHDNKAGNAGGIYGEGITLVNSTITENVADALASGISWDMDEGLTLINTTVARNGPAPGIRGHGNTSGTGPVHLENTIIAGNGTPVSNCWYPSESFVRVGVNVADDLTCGDASQMSIENPALGAFGDRRGPSPTVASAPTTASRSRKVYLARK
ncbi:MAG TPA: right-handed parallel beta-helix repeat-containing protein [Gemmatimonadaceae bacterium]|nr:right-handed parallel beta-helix repeat-containing protein [Gemmatimonadaceae bacterium]